MRRLAVIAAAAFMAASATAAHAEKTRLQAEYSIHLTGIPVARGSMSVELSDDGYVASGSAKTSGLIRLISKGDGTARVRGELKSSRVVASNFLGRYNSSRRAQRIEMSVQNGVATEISVKPPRPEKEKGRVPITQEARTNIVDPLSAMFAFVAKGDLMSPETCNRTLPIFDGRYRFNVVLAYARTEQFETAEGYRGPVLVCRARYVPIAGHRDHKTVQQMAATREMFVWLVPIGRTRVLAPIKASVGSPIGTFVVEARRFVTSQR